MLKRLTRFFIFPSHLVPHPGHARSYPHVEQCRLATDAGDVEYFFARAGGDEPGEKPVVFFAHGNGEVIDQWVLPLLRYRELGVHLVLVEYRGYGRSAGKPSEEAIVSDFLAIRDLVCARPDVDARRVIYHGRSIGGGVVCSAARHKPPAGLILQSTFTDLYAIAKRFLAVRSMLADRFESLEAVRTLTCPVLVFHGTVDRLIPQAHGQALCEAAVDGRLCLFPKADHNSPIDGDPAYWLEIEALVQHCGSRIRE